MVHSHLLRDAVLPLGSRMGFEPIFAIGIAIPIHPIEKNRNCIPVINRRCQWTLRLRIFHEVKLSFEL